MTIGWSEKSSSGFLCSNWSQAKKAPERAGLPLGGCSMHCGAECLPAQWTLETLAQWSLESWGTPGGEDRGEVEDAKGNKEGEKRTVP